MDMRWGPTGAGGVAVHGGPAVCESERREVRIHDAEEDADGLAAHRLAPLATRMQRAVAELEQQPLLRVHRARLG